ncbi:Mov34/MPN/PAD-1 family protein [Burkholderia diffusa]|uniref:Mov34/MPN/PAD-1 family protein n=1 Tax=Burkholderia diffusa TaxID=488732 RepID=UPI0039F56DCA
MRLVARIRSKRGGVLVGYVASNNEPVVQHIIGPGPAARHKRQRFHPDHDWQCHRLDDIFEASSGRAVYLGDWHTHPDGSPHMSWLDKRTLRGIARHRGAEMMCPLMLIGGGGQEIWKWRVHRYVGEYLAGLNGQCDVLDIQSYIC